MKDMDRNFQGIWIPKMIYLNTEINWHAKILFLEIHSFTEHEKECYMSNKYISSFLKISERQVSRYISELKQIGWIEETAFDGRKRYLRSMLQFSFRTVDSDLTLMSRQQGQFLPNSNVKNDHHNKPITKQHNKSITFLKENIENRSSILK